MLIRSGDVTLKSFEPALSDTAYRIRNHESVRSQMRNQEPIPRASHDEWVRENLLENKTVHLFIVYAGEEAVGMALLKNFQHRSAEIGVMVVDPHRRPLVCYKAAHLIGYYAFEVLDLSEVVSLVPRHNAHALAFNLHCGLKPTGKDTDIYHELSLTQAHSRSHATHKRFREKYGIDVIKADDD